MNGKNSLRRIALVLFMLVLLPTAFYTVYEFSTLNTSEQMLSEMYSRQLDAILYSVNEHASAVLSSWAQRASVVFDMAVSGKLKQAGEAVRNTPMDDIQVVSATLVDSTAKIFTLPDALTEYAQPFDTVAWERALKNNASKLERLVRYKRSGYLKVEPIFIGDSVAANSQVLIAFAFQTSGPVQLAVVQLNDAEFIRVVIGRKLRDISGNNLILGIIHRNSESLVFSTSDANANELRQQKRLWHFPNYNLGIRLQGTTIDELARSRTQRNLVLILFMDILLLAGAWFVYRNIRREMELVRIKSDFVSNVSHELRTPLALIRMFGETLEMGRVKNEEKKQEYYSTIVKESERLTRLINNILDFTKMESGKKRYTFSDGDINALVANVMNTYSHHLHSEGFVPQMQLAEKLPTLSIDTEAVTEAVINLIDNAIKYSGDEKSLSVRTLQRDAMVAVEVEDHGVGIAHEHRKKIFDTFYRVGTALVHNTKGSGLGLSLVKHIMDAHGGRVEVESVLGKGSTFRLLFPIKQTA